MSHKHGLAAKYSQNGSLWSCFFRDKFLQDSKHLSGWNFSEWKSWMFTCYRRRQKYKLFEVTFSFNYEDIAIAIKFLLSPWVMHSWERECLSGECLSQGGRQLKFCQLINICHRLSKMKKKRQQIELVMDCLAGMLKLPAHVRSINNLNLMTALIIS